MGKHGDKKKGELIAGTERARSKGCNCIDMFNFSIDCPLHHEKACKQRDCIIEESKTHFKNDKTGLFTVIWLNSIGAKHSRALGCTCGGPKTLDNGATQYSLDSECPIHKGVMGDENVEALMKKNIGKAVEWLDNTEGW